MSHSASAPPDGPQGSPPGSPRVSRRWFVAGAGVIVLAAGGGVGVGLSTDRHATRVTSPPAELLDAVDQERRLIADLDATTGGDFAVRRVIVQVRADHAAHLTELQELVATYEATTPSGARSSAAGKHRGTPRTRAQLHAAEGHAWSAGVGRAARLTGAQAQLATLLASIAACEATHADLLG